MKYVVLMLACAMVAFIVAFPFFMEERREAAERLKVMVLIGNETLPKMIDGITRLDSIDGKRYSMQFNYTILDYSKNIQVNEIKENLYSQFVTESCLNEVISETILDAGIPLIYSYKDLSGIEILKVEFTKNDC